MIQLLILEDEKKERDTLAQMISQHFQNEIEVKSADNAIYAKELFQQYHFDILISDINLPGMNGLDFVAYIRTHHPQTMVYMLTSYHYFQYGMRAMELKVKDFLLKPIQWDSLKQSLEEALYELNKGQREANLKKKMEDVKVLLEKDCIYALIEQKEETYLQHIFEVLECKPKGAFAIYGKQMHEVKQWAKEHNMMFLQARYFDMQVGYLFLEQIVDLHKRNIWSEWFHHHQIKFGSIQCAMEDYYRSFQEVLHEQQQNLKYYLEDDEHTNQYFQTLQQQIHYYVYKLDATAIKKEEIRFLQQVQPLPSQLKQIRYQQLQQVLHQACGVLIQPLKEDTSIFLPIYQMIEMMQESHEEVFMNQETSQDEQVSKAIRYITMNYAKNISLNDVAEYLQLTPFYVSRLIKEKTGITYSEMVTRCRIQQAKKLLLKQQLSMNEIAKQCGFLSVNYFIKVFRKMTGDTPKEYISRYNYETINR